MIQAWRIDDSRSTGRGQGVRRRSASGSCAAWTMTAEQRRNARLSRRRWRTTGCGCSAWHRVTMGCAARRPVPRRSPSSKARSDCWISLRPDVPTAPADDAEGWRRCRNDHRRLSGDRLGTSPARPESRHGTWHAHRRRRSTRWTTRLCAAIDIRRINVFARVVPDKSCISCGLQANGEVRHDRRRRERRPGA